jgi:gliding motility-associated-like protein
MKSFYFLLIFILGFSTIHAQYDVSIEQKIAENMGNFPINLDDEDWLGYSVEGIGDLNNDGINDIAISALKDDDGGFNRGAIYILFLNIDGTVNSYQKISDTQGNFSEPLDDWDIFGSSISYLGDMNGDGLIEIGVGAEYDEDGGYRHGAIYILSLNPNGTVNSSVKISDTQGGFTGNLSDWDVFGTDIELLGDLNGDGNQDIAVGSRRHSDDGMDRGAVWILFLNSNFTVASHQKISNSQGSFSAGLGVEDYFGASIANIGDLNNDGVTDIAVGAYRDDDGGANKGCVYILFLNSNGTVSSHQKISETAGNFNETFAGDNIGFGRSIDKSADINGDGLTEILVGAPGYKNSGQANGAFYILNLNPNGTVNAFEKYTEGTHNFTGPLSDGGSFGTSVSYIGALQKSHAIVSGAYLDFAQGIEKGSAWVLQLGNFQPDVAANLDTVLTTCNSRTIDVDYTISNIGDGTIFANTPIAFYADNNLIGTSATQNDIPTGGSETGNISLNVPTSIPENFTFSITVDDNGSGTGSITEADENNNTDNAIVDLGSASLSNPLNDLYVCDNVSADGFAIFDLTLNTPLAIGSQTGVAVSYHLSLAEANTDVKPISNPSNYTNTTNPQPIFLRLESTADPSCFVVESFQLQVVNGILATDPPPLSICDGLDNDGVGIFDLTAVIPSVTGNQSDIEVTFHVNANDATNGTNPIAKPAEYQNISNPQTIYVRVESRFLSSCFATVPLKLEVKPINPTTTFEGLQNCDKGFDTGYFDLTQAEDELESNQNITGYYLSIEDVENKTNAIANPSNYQNVENPQTVFVRINTTGEECPSFGMVELSVGECPPFIPEGFSPNADGINDVFEISGLYEVFPNFELTVFSRYGNIVYEGNNNVPEWEGTSDQGNELPTATYFYVLDLNDPNYKTIKGWVYLMR